MKRVIEYYNCHITIDVFIITVRPGGLPCAGAARKHELRMQNMINATKMFEMQNVIKANLNTSLQGKI